MSYPDLETDFTEHLPVQRFQQPYERNTACVREGVRVHALYICSFSASDTSGCA